jgi:hypothetical protein
VHGVIAARKRATYPAWWQHHQQKRHARATKPNLHDAAKIGPRTYGSQGVFEDYLKLRKKPTFQSTCAEMKLHTSIWIKAIVDK